MAKTNDKFSFQRNCGAASKETWNTNICRWSRDPKNVTKLRFRALALRLEKLFPALSGAVVEYLWNVSVSSDNDNSFFILGISGLKFDMGNTRL